MKKPGFILKKTLIVLSTLLIAASLSACSTSSSKASENEITVSAAASLTESLTEISTRYEDETGNRVNLNFGSSGALQKQIEQGAPADIFLSAGQSQMDALEEKGILKEGSRSDLLENELVLLESEEYSDELESIEDLKTVSGKIAIGEVETVPAGQYAEESLKNLGVWSSAAEKLVFAKDVKAVLSYVERGEAAAGIVYKSDALSLNSAFIVEEIDPSSYSDINYPIAIIENTKSDKASEDFLNYLKKDSSSEIFVKYGFNTK